MRKIKRYQVLKIFENNVFPTKMALKTLNSIKNGIENIDFNTRILEITESIDFKPTQLSLKAANLFVVKIRSPVKSVPQSLQLKLV